MFAFDPGTRHQPHPLDTRVRGQRTSPSCSNPVQQAGLIGVEYKVEELSSTMTIIPQRGQLIYRSACSLQTFLCLFVRRLLVHLNYTAGMKMLTSKRKSKHMALELFHMGLEESSWAAMENPSPGSQPALSPASASVVFHFPSLKVRPSMEGEPPLQCC